GPNIWTACLAPLIVTLLNRIVSGFAGRLGATTARRVVKPSLLLVSGLQNGAPAGPVLDPMTRSMCATSLPSPTSDSPRKKSAAMWGDPFVEEKVSKWRGLNSGPGVYHTILGSYVGFLLVCRNRIH